MPTTENWYWRCKGNELVYNSGKNTHVHQSDLEYRVWVKVWGEAAPCPVNENGEDDINAITDALLQQDKKLRKATQAALEMQDIPSYGGRDWEEYAYEREKRMARGTPEGFYVRTKG
jgi:hypothetical protein